MLRQSHILMLAALTCLASASTAHPTYACTSVASGEQAAREAPTVTTNSEVVVEATVASLVNASPELERCKADFARAEQECTADNKNAWCRTFIDKWVLACQFTDVGQLRIEKVRKGDVGASVAVKFDDVSICGEEVYRPKVGDRLNFCGIYDDQHMLHVSPCSLPAGQ